MKSKIKSTDQAENHGEIITQFGRAQLVRTPGGRLEIVGGSKDDHTAAKEWMSLFLHEASVSFPE